VGLEQEDERDESRRPHAPILPGFMTGSDRNRA
jgi:hypothetical protein